MYVFDYDPTIGINQRECLFSPLVQSSELFQNVPNPFSQATSIRYEVGSQDFVALGVYDVAGRLVRTLSTGNMKPGTYVVRWDGRDERGNAVSSACYFLHLRTETAVKAKKMVILK